MRIKNLETKSLVLIEKSLEKISITKPWREMAVVPTILFFGFTSIYFYEFWQTKVLLTPSWKVVAVVDFVLMPWLSMMFFGMTRMTLDGSGFKSEDKFVNLFNFSVPNREIKSFGIEIKKMREWEWHGVIYTYYLTLEKVNGDSLRVFKTHKESDAVAAQTTFNNFLNQTRKI